MKNYDEYPQSLATPKLWWVVALCTTRHSQWVQVDGPGSHHAGWGRIPRQPTGFLDSPCCAVQYHVCCFAWRALQIMFVCVCGCLEHFHLHLQVLLSPT